MVVTVCTLLRDGDLDNSLREKKKTPSITSFILIVYNLLSLSRCKHNSKVWATTHQSNLNYYMMWYGILLKQCGPTF